MKLIVWPLQNLTFVIMLIQVCESWQMYQEIWMSTKDAGRIKDIYFHTAEG